MLSFYIITSLTIALIIYGAIEYQLHQKNLKSIPIRIHINGTRGKSSVTRLVGAGLRAGGLKTITKVTGTYPRIISHTVCFDKTKRWLCILMAKNG